MITGMWSEVLLCDFNLKVSEMEETPGEKDVRDGLD